MKTFERQGDLRVRRTHKLLWEALMAELAERAFEEITVKDICERAMVHRTTFYTHYEDKYALLKQGMRQMYDTLQADVDMERGAFSADDPPPSIIRLFIHVAEHRHFYKLMLCGEGNGWFQKLVKAYIAEHAQTKASASTPVNQSVAVPPAMQAQFVAGAFISILAWWLENDMLYSPHQMAQYFLSLCGPLPLHGH